MLIGKTSHSISKAEVFSKFGEVQVLSTVFPEIKEVPCVICSPLRSDRNPSFSIYMDNGGHIRFKDHANPSIHGGLLDLLRAYWGCSLNQALSRVCSIMPAGAEGALVRPKPITALTRNEAHFLSSLQVKVRPWAAHDYAYWASYGISPEWLRYADVWPISHKIIVKHNPSSGKSRRYVFPADRYAYCFVERKQGAVQLKVYQPFNIRGFKWCSKMDASVISLWSKIPEHGNRVVICSSLKDALVISCQLHIPAICLQGEGYSMSATAVSELKRRYQKVFISFDTDAPGIQDSKRLAQHTGFINVIPDLGAQKDFSDYYKSLQDKSQFQQLKSLFN